MSAEWSLKTSNGLNGGGLMEEVGLESRLSVEKRGERAFQVEEEAQGKINNDYNHLAICVGK